MITDLKHFLNLIISGSFMKIIFPNYNGCYRKTYVFPYALRLTSLARYVTTEIQDAQYYTVSLCAVSMIIFQQYKDKICIVC